MNILGVILIALFGFITFLFLGSAIVLSSLLSREESDSDGNNTSTGKIHR